MRPRESAGLAMSGTSRVPLPRRLGIVISGVVLVTGNLATLLYTVISYLIRPAGLGDTNYIDGAWSTAFFSTVLAVGTGVLTIIPVALRWLRPWWFLVPVLLLVVSTARWTYINRTYPEWLSSYPASGSISDIRGYSEPEYPYGA